jgi:N-acetyl sugar amidotransferase
MDSSARDIQYDAEGVCNYCRQFEKVIARYHPDESEANKRLNAMRAAVKRRAGKARYECVIGLSGGVDSSYVAYLAWKLGLNCLAVHFDNGWNSEISVANIKNIVQTTGFDLHTYVIDWPEFRNLQRAFIKASVIDIELVTDHAIFAAMYRLTREKKIQTILSGTNFTTEHGMPDDWSWNKQDLTNLRAINKEFGELPMRNLPTIGSLRWQLMLKCGIGPRFEEPLDLISYRKTEAMRVLREVFGWREYGGKHQESVFTKFYQGYILPAKFGVDKRRVHFSALIRNREMTRSEACEELKREIYDADELKAERAYVLKKLGFSEEEFEKIMALPVKRHDEYASEWAFTQRLLRYGAWMKNVGRSLARCLSHDVAK